MQEQVGGVRYLGHLAADRFDGCWVGVPERAHREAGDQVQVLAAISIPDPAASAKEYGHRGHAVVRHERGREPLLEGFCIGNWLSPGRTMVPMPESVKISRRTAWLSRPSRTW